MRDAAVRLEPITTDNVGAVYRLAVAQGQDAFVASNPWSLAQALAAGGTAWPRAIVAGEEVVGFLMLEIDPEEERGRTFFLWRLMVGAAFQRRGYGSAAVALAMEEVRRRDGTEIWTSWVDAEGGPAPFYAELGFEPLGGIEAGEVVACRRL